jgi:hypothetical protein
VDGKHFREITIDDRTVYVRRGTCQSDVKVEKTTFDDRAGAEAHARGLIDKLPKQRWADDGEVARWVPDEESSSARAARKTVRRAWSEALGPLRAKYRELLKSARIARDVSFFAQASADQDPNDLARNCLAAAESAYGVEFARAHFDDVEHDTGGWPLLDDEFARFYESPARVAEIAEKRLAGKLGADDGRFPKRSS